jgi:hypothetical protein
MIVVRNIFRMKFGEAKQAGELWKQAVGVLEQSGVGRGNARLLTDLAGGPFYTFVLETTHESLAQWEEHGRTIRANPKWKEVYPKIAAMTVEGSREIFTVIDQG